jgi:hypothetical protein
MDGQGHSIEAPERRESADHPRGRPRSAGGEEIEDEDDDEDDEEGRG